MVLAYSSGGLVRGVRGELVDARTSEVAIAAQHHRAALSMDLPLVAADVRRL